VMWITYRHVAEGRDPTPRRIDVPGQITLIGGLFLLVLALLRGNEDGWGSTGSIARQGGGVGRRGDQRGAGGGVGAAGRLLGRGGALARADAAPSPPGPAPVRR